MSADGNELRIKVELPQWLKDARRPLAQLSALYREYGSIPRAVFGLVSVYILNGLFDIFSVFVGSVLAAFDYIVAAFGFAQAFLVGAFGAVGIDILGVLLDLQTAIAAAVRGLGPLGPPVAVAAAGVAVYVLVTLGSRLFRRFVI